MLFEENSEKEKKEPHGNCQKTSRIKNHNKSQKKIKPKPNCRQIRKIMNKFRERKKVIQTANKFEKTKSKQTTVALTELHRRSDFDLSQTQIKNSQSVRRILLKLLIL